MMNNVNETGKPWMAWHAAEFLSSNMVQGMTMAERGIYITLLSMCWRDGNLPNDNKKLGKLVGLDQRTLVKFREAYGRFTESFPEASGNFPEASGSLRETSGTFTYPKLSFFQQRMAKRGVPGSAVEQSKEENRTAQTCTHATRDAEPASVGVSVLETTTIPFRVEHQVPVQAQTGSPSQTRIGTSSTTEPVTPSTTPFDPRSFAAPVGDYSASEVRRILDYHFVHHPSDYWTDPARGKITSPARLAKAIAAMAEQVPEGWAAPVPAAPKPVQTRTVGDASCKRCRGRGRVAKQTPKGLMYSVECPDCKPHQQVVSDGVWVDAA